MLKVGAAADTASSRTSYICRQDSYAELDAPKTQKPCSYLGGSTVATFQAQFGGGISSCNECCPRERNEGRAASTNPLGHTHHTTAVQCTTRTDVRCDVAKGTHGHNYTIAITYCDTAYMVNVAADAKNGFEAERQVHLHDESHRNPNKRHVQFATCIEDEETNGLGKT